jgi:hypothetical protein
MYLALFVETEDRIIYKIARQSLSTDVKTRVRTLHLDSCMQLLREMKAYNIDLRQ